MDFLLKAAKKIIQYIRDDYSRQTVAVTVPSVFGSVIYASLTLLAAVMSRSTWLYIMTAFYVITIFLRVIVLLRSARYVFTHDNRFTAVNNYVFFSRLLLISDLVLGIAMIAFSTFGIHHDYPGYTLYLTAVYVLFKTFLSLYNLIKAHRSRSLLALSLRKINVVKTIVSVLILEGAVMSRFANPHSQYAQNINFGFSIGAFLMILIMSLEGIFVRRGKYADV